MPNIDKHRAGSFCWLELATSDQTAAKAFYSSLFGWSIRDFPMGPDGTYTIFQLDGRDASAACSLQPDQAKLGVPPHWMLYVCVDSADAAAASAKSLGGKVLAGPFDVFQFGRMAVVQDPAGAVFSVWQAKDHIGTGIEGEDGTFCWADLNTPDAAGATKFYTGLFGWEIMGGKDSGYLHIKNGEDFIGGIPPAELRNPNAPPHWMLYFAVDDVDATAAEAEGKGGRLYLKPTTIDKVGRMAVVADPQGAAFAIFREAEPEAA